MASAEEDWDRRILCSDGNCIGIIGEDGCCRSCGKPYAGEQPLPASPDDENDEEPPVETVAAPPASTEAPPADEPAVDDDWENRRLCIDESCIGVIGPDGRCNECGKPYTE